MMLSQREVTNDITQLNISGLSSGVYFVKCQSANDIITVKFIKE